MNDQILLIMTTLIFLLTLLTTPHTYAVDPSINWKVIKTPHFEVIYDAKQHQIAQQYAGYAEYSFDLLSPIFKEFPDKTVVVIDDSSDQANGYATRLPYPLINVRPVLPEQSETIGMYGNWGYELILHEYTHILSFEPAHGVVRPLRWIFGSIMSPNLVLPRWWLEGLAVKIETDFSEWGRLRSNSQDAVLRALAEENRLTREDIARANESGILEYPFGSRPYLLGSLMWQKMVSEKGYDAIYNLTQRYSSRTPFLFLDTPSIELFGKGYQNLLTPIIHETQKKAQTQIETIRRSPQTKSKELSFKGLSSGLPDVSPDEKKIIYITRGHNWASEIVLVDGNSTVFSGKDRIGNIMRISWHPNSKKIIYDKVGADSNRYSTYYDIYERDLTDFKKENQVTKGRRAQQPAYSLDGKQIVYIQNGAGWQALATMNGDGTNSKILYSPPLQHRISFPEFISDEEIIFSERNLKGEEQLTVLNLTRNKFHRVLKDFMPAYNPRRTKAGIVFISEHSGVANAYLANNSLTQATALTNTISRVNHIDLNLTNNKLYYTELTGRGSRVSESPYLSNTKLKPPKVFPATEISVKKEIAESELDSRLAQSVSKYPIKDYSSWRYMLPTYWLPFIYPLPTGVFIEAMTSNSDPLGKHSYTGLFTYNTSTASNGAFFTYLNNQTQLPLTLSYSNFEEFLVTSSTTRKNQTAFFGSQTYIYNLPKKWQLLTGWTYSQRDIAIREVIRTGPKITVMYNTTSQKGDEISPESGNTFGVNYTHYYAQEPTLTRLNYEEYGLEWGNYFSSWFPERHVLYSHLKGLYANYGSALIAGGTTAGAVFQSTLFAGDFLMRGYPSGAFLGTRVANFNLEYRFPILKINRGAGMTPFFARRMHGRFFVDAIILDGFYFDIQRNDYIATNVQKGYGSVGTEIHLETNTFFYLPLNIFLGVYYGMDDAISGGGITPFFGITL